MPAHALSSLAGGGGARIQVESAGLEPDRLNPYVVRAMAELSVPLAVLHGAEEQLVNGGFFSQLELPTLWRSKIQTVAGAGHAIHWEQPERFNELVAAFVADCVGRKWRLQ